MLLSRLRVVFVILLICLIFIAFNLHFKKHITATTINGRSTIKEKPEKLALNKTLTNSSVLCIIMTSEKTFMERSITVWNSWAKKCHKALFACNCLNVTKILISNSKTNSIFQNLYDFKNALDIPIWQLELTENYDHMADKVFKIVKSAFDQYGHLYKWFLLTDDDTFTFVDNMHSFVSKKSYKEPVTYGYNFKVIVPQGYHSGGGGVLFTHEAMKRIAFNINKKICNEKEGYGDVALGNCAYRSKVKLGNSLDDEGRERFHPLDFQAHFKGHFPDWLIQYTSNGVKTGDECCSDETITFHYTSVNEMKAFAKLKNQSEFKKFRKF